jgi:hypothetical protein
MVDIVPHDRENYTLDIQGIPGPVPAFVGQQIFPKIVELVQADRKK